MGVSALPSIKGGPQRTAHPIKNGHQRTDPSAPNQSTPHSAHEESAAYVTHRGREQPVGTQRLSRFCSR